MAWQPPARLCVLVCCSMGSRICDAAGMYPYPLPCRLVLHSHERHPRGQPRPQTDLLLLLCRGLVFCLRRQPCSTAAFPLMRLRNGRLGRRIWLYCLGTRYALRTENPSSQCGCLVSRAAASNVTASTRLWCIGGWYCGRQADVRFCFGNPAGLPEGAGPVQGACSSLFLTSTRVRCADPNRDPKQAVHTAVPA